MVVVVVAAVVVAVVVTTTVSKPTVVLRTRDATSKVFGVDTTNKQP